MRSIFHLAYVVALLLQQFTRSQPQFIVRLKFLHHRPTFLRLLDVKFVIQC